MIATIVDLRYKMRDVLKALKRNESVTILYRGQVTGTIIPAQVTSTADQQKKVAEHPFFGMHQNAVNTVGEEMERLRKGRYTEI